MRLHSLVVAATDEIVLGGGVWKEPYLAGALLCVVGCWKSGWRVKTAQAYIFKKLTLKNEIMIKKTPILFIVRTIHLKLFRGYPVESKLIL